MIELLKKEPEQIIRLRELERYHQHINLRKPHKGEDLVDEEQLKQEHNPQLAQYVTRFLMMSIEHFQKWSYLSPNADACDLVPGSKEFGKQAIVVMHELLSFTPEKRLSLIGYRGQINRPRMFDEFSNTEDETLFDEDAKVENMVGEFEHEGDMIMLDGASPTDGDEMEVGGVYDAHTTILYHLKRSDPGNHTMIHAGACQMLAGTCATLAPNWRPLEVERLINMLRAWAPLPEPRDVRGAPKDLEFYWTTVNDPAERFKRSRTCGWARHRSFI
ncbi:hypothetical protein ACLOJK_038120 [Asimina triloba]